MKALLKEIRRNPLLWLLSFVPVVFISGKVRPEAHTLLFLLSVLAIVPLAALLSHATESVAASGGLLIMQGVGAAAGPLVAGLAMSASEHGLAYTFIATQIFMAAFGVYRSTRRAAPPDRHKGSFVVEPPVPVGTELAVYPNAKQHDARHSCMDV